MKRVNYFSFWLLLTLGISTVVFHSCGENDDDSTIAVTNVSLDKATLTLSIGEDGMLTATVMPNNATNKAVTWTSSDEAKATVSDGKVTAKAAGEVTITAKAGDKTATCKVTITEDPLISDAGVVINGVKWATRNVGEPGKFVANIEDAGMLYQWNRKIGWSSTDPMKDSNGGANWDSTNFYFDTLK